MKSKKSRMDNARLRRQTRALRSSLAYERGTNERLRHENGRLVDILNAAARTTLEACRRERQMLSQMFAGSHEAQ